ncbi:uncharacterized protein LOC128198038 [Bicyclus anynana]|uniref:Uncharacterized protein LOC128198038 n=1 Tax=Bicyclus anynana TaxID=110368 RepID=A0ABM3M5C4_BICAN|nr:uncharacterized protein LOC128198038 [Bicyclus anynana]
MVQRPFSEDNPSQDSNNSKQHVVVYPGFAQIKSIVHRMQRPKMSTILTSADTGKNKTMFSRMNIARNEILHPFDLRMAKYAITNAKQGNEVNHDPDVSAQGTMQSLSELMLNSYNIPSSIFFPTIEEKSSHSIEKEAFIKSTAGLNSNKTAINDIGTLQSFSSKRENTAVEEVEAYGNELNFTAPQYHEPDIRTVVLNDNRSLNSPLNCREFKEAKTDIDAQEVFSEFDIEVIKGGTIGVLSHLVIFRQYCNAYHYDFSHHG